LGAEAIETSYALQSGFAESLPYICFIRIDACGGFHQPKGKKAEDAIARKKPADNNFDLEQRFKKIAEFFSQLIECICGFVELLRIFRCDLATVCQIIFIKYFRQFG